MIEFIQLVLLLLFYFRVSENEGWHDTWSEYLDSVLTVPSIIWMSTAMGLSALWGTICGATFWQVYRSWDRYEHGWTVAAIGVVVITLAAVLVMGDSPVQF